MVTETPAERFALRPVFVTSLEPVESVVWSDLIWMVPGPSALVPGSFIFTNAGEFAGMVVEHGGRRAIVPAALVLAEGERLVGRVRSPAGDVGIHVQSLTPDVAAATGASAGVVVTWVNPAGPAAGIVAVGDVIETVSGQPVPTLEHWRVRLARLEAGETLALGVRGRGRLRDIQVLTPAFARPIPNRPSLGLHLQRLSSAGATVLGVDPDSAAARAGLAAGDVITLHRRPLVADSSPGAHGVRRGSRLDTRSWSASLRWHAPGDDPLSMTSLQLGGYDPLDAQLDDVAIAPARPARRSSLRRRLAGWSASSVPVASLLLVGMAMGPRGISLLSPGVLSLLDPAMPVALAVLGALVGLSVDFARRQAAGAGGWLRRVALTIAIVAAGIALLAPIVWPSTASPLWMLAGGLGLCAATSLAVPSGNPGAARRQRRVVELGVLAPIVFGGLLLGVTLQGATLAALTLVGQAAVIAVLLAGSAWLLLARASSDTEQRVFAFAAMLLVGGAADYLSLSALLSGLMTGAFWRLAGGPAEASLRRDALYLQHSLLVLVLVVAGARTDFSLTAVAVAAMYVFLRTAGK